MEQIIYGNIYNESLEVVKRDSKFYIRYDAGAHQVIWREDEITKEEAESIIYNSSAVSSVLWNVQARLTQQGSKRPKSNWNPS
ncbi:hypothetical protein [Celerinatantimonas sp. MCCC 1A17872]|uniref:hypothetical protein n=1 Tax=Celerinatantimonas sp. MCCC 1A17872 TaxID=3177514 RepID=UPI0038C092AB